jgi:hypothetical protein
VANFKITFPKILYYFIYYNYIFEFVLGEGSDVHIMVQNVFMYLDSIVCNLLLLGLKVVFIKQYSLLSWCLYYAVLIIQRIVRCLYYAVLIIKYFVLSGRLYYVILVIQYNVLSGRLCYVILIIQYSVLSARLYYVITTKDDLKSVNLVLLL